MTLPPKMPRHCLVAAQLSSCFSRKLCIYQEWLTIKTFLFYFLRRFLCISISLSFSTSLPRQINTRLARRIHYLIKYSVVFCYITGLNKLRCCRLAVAGFPFNVHLASMLSRPRSMGGGFSGLFPVLWEYRSFHVCYVAGPRNSASKPQ